MRYDIESAKFWKIRFLDQIPENCPWESRFRLRVASNLENGPWGNQFVGHFPMKMLILTGI